MSSPFDKQMHLAEMLLALKLRGKEDRFRRRYPFSEDIAATNAILFDPRYSKVRKRKAYRSWLETVPNQPCIFGRIAARNNNVFICLMEEAEILSMRRGDDDLRDTIHDHRQAWKRYALEGLSSAFVIVLVSQQLVNKQPDDQLKSVCKRLMELYLEVDSISDDAILQEREYVFLRRQNKERGARLLKFSTLPNIFCAQGDGRWWHDHRTPGGLMITSNALGHFMYSRSAKPELDDANKMWALENAMLTIHGAYHGTAPAKRVKFRHRPSTSLVRASEAETSPLRPTSKVREFSVDHYEGYFHTDHLIPSVFFQESADPQDLKKYDNLTLRYIFDPTIDPDDHRRLVTGEEANWFEVRRGVDRLPAFANPERPGGFPRPLHEKLKRWLVTETKRRLEG